MQDNIKQLTKLEGLNTAKQVVVPNKRGQSGIQTRLRISSPVGTLPIGLPIAK